MNPVGSDATRLLWSELWRDRVEAESVPGTTIYATSRVKGFLTSNDGGDRRQDERINEETLNRADASVKPSVDAASG